MIYGIGTDIVNIDRMAGLYDRYGDRLVRRMLTDAEAVLLKNESRRARFLAMRFAAKEAIVKAMGVGFGRDMSMRDAAVVSNARGRPEISWSDRGREVCARLGIGESHLTLSDDSGFAVAVAVMMRRSA